MLRSGTLLLIKFPGAERATDSPTPANLLDIAPTVLRHFGLPQAAYNGVPLQDAPPESPRATSFSIWQGPWRRSDWVPGLPRRGFRHFERVDDQWVYVGTKPAG